MRRTYTTTAGDTFDIISRKVYGVGTGASKLQRANPGVVEPLRPGVQLRIP